MRPALSLLCVAVALTCVHPAGAQSKGAAAESLFEEGRKAMDSKDFDTACTRFRESNRIDPAPGTVLNLARCEEARGKLATAWELYRRALEELPEGDDRRPVASKLVDALTPRLPKLTIRLRAGAPTGTVVRLGEVELAAGSLGVPVPVDPGEISLIVKSPGRRERTVAVTLSETERREIEVEPGEPSGGDASSPIGAKGGSSRSTVGWVVGGVGLAGLVVGSVTGAMLLGKKKTVDDNCNADKLCTQAGTDAAESGRSLAPWTTAGLIVGVAGIGVGAYLVLTSDSGNGTQTAISASPVAGGMQLKWDRTW